MRLYGRVESFRPTAPPKNGAPGLRGLAKFGPSALVTLRKSPRLTGGVVGLAELLSTLTYLLATEDIEDGLYYLTDTHLPTSGDLPAIRLSQSLKSFQGQLEIAEVGIQPVQHGYQAWQRGQRATPFPGTEHRLGNIHIDGEGTLLPFAALP